MQSNVKVGVQWCFLLPYQWYHHHHLHAWMSPMKRIAAFFGQHQTICRHCQFWESTLPVQLFHIYLLPPAAFKNLVWKHIAYPPLFLPLPSPCHPPPFLFHSAFSCHCYLYLTADDRHAAMDKTDFSAKVWHIVASKSTTKWSAMTTWHATLKLSSLMWSRFSQC